MPAKKMSRKATAESVMNTILASCESTAALNEASKPAPLGKSVQEANAKPASFLDKPVAAGDLLSASFLPPSTDEMEMADKIALLEKNLAAAIAENADMVDRLAKYVADSLDVDSRVAAAQKEASEAVAAKKKLEAEKASLEKALAEAEKKAAGLEEILQAKEAFDKLREEAAKDPAKLAKLENSLQLPKPPKYRPLAAQARRYSVNGYEGWN